MRVFGIGFAAMICCLAATAQDYDFDAMRLESNEVYPGEATVVYSSEDHYTFHLSSGKESPITGKMESVKVLVKKTGRYYPAVFESTSSFSVIRGVSASKYYADRNRMRNALTSVKTEHYESNGIFHNDFYINKLLVQDEENGVYQISYSKLYSDYKFLASVSLGGNNPTLNEKVTLDIPAWMDATVLEKNLDGFSIDKKQEPLSDGGTRYIYTWKNIPKFGGEIYSPSNRFYEPHLIIVYNAYEKRGERAELMPDAGGLYAWYRSLVDQVDNQPEGIAPLVAQFESMPKGEAQIDSVNGWVRDNIRYIAFESGIAGFKPESCQNVYSKRYGDCKGMANLCKNILVGLGYDARLAWIGTRREIPYGYEIPSLIVDNHMIAAVKTDSGFVFLDPTETYGRSAEYAFRIQGRPVMIEDGENYILTHVPESPAGSDRVFRQYDVRFDPETSTSRFDVSAVYTGEPKKQILSGFNSIFARDREKALSRYLRTNRTGSFELKSSTGLDKTDDEIVLKYGFSSSEGVIDLGGEYYIDIDPSYDLEDARAEEDRRAPWFFGERYNRETRIEFDVPEGWSLNYVPESFDVQNEDFQVKVAVTREAGKLQVDKLIHIYNGSISREHQPEWETTMKKLKSYYDDKVIIRKN